MSPFLFIGGLKPALQGDRKAQTPGQLTVALATFDSTLSSPSELYAVVAK
jgi:hypothetical protein